MKSKLTVQNPDLALQVAPRRALYFFDARSEREMFLDLEVESATRGSIFFRVPRPIALHGTPTAEWVLLRRATEQDLAALRVSL